MEANVFRAAHPDDANAAAGGDEHLVMLDQSNWLAALEVRIADEQLVMVAHHQPVALEILAKAYLQPGGRRWEPLGYVDADGSIVAVLALSHADGVAQVRNLAVDMRHQRRGVGSQVMRAVIDWCHRTGASTVELTFNPRNEAAARLYQRVGLRPTGELRDGEPVWNIDVRAPRGVVSPP